MALLDTAQLDTMSEIIGKETYRTIFQSYLADSAAKLAQLKEVVDAQDADHIEKLSHSLKSATSNLGMVDLAARFATMEQQGKAADVAGAQASLGGLDSLYQDSIAALEEYLA
ncbi:hypothetical protein FJM67_06545 [Maribrevibacterium harenarium]|uniref:HPt domain-containing protein n=1 Tax=Maribrevibacterium harenarium TaxID=2589817 RepID=A0A501WY50_9GAMM|nr:Hpt domain-containing protein [Maribrevibacterium harenarium]TPE53460.1 hypothetical protein FJM67_06545 [Maribrevibacterium harenarium]